MWPFLLPVFERAKESPLNQRVVQRKTTMHARRSHDRLIVEEPNDYFFFFTLDGPSFEGLLKIFKPTLAKEILT
jgi:hypothetical protein